MESKEMAESNTTPNNTDDEVLSANDPLDINELASLNDEISNEFIDQLQSQISESANIKIKNDGDLFEEPSDKPSKSAVFNNDIDDNFIKKYKAKLKKQQNPQKDEDENYDLKSRSVPEIAEQAEAATQEPQQTTENTPVAEAEVSAVNMHDAVPSADKTETESPQSEPVTSEIDNSIETITGGNIIEKPLTKDITEYNESLDLLDNNIKYSKYVIYIDPENKDFIDSLTVKERKNLINKIIKEQDSIAVTKRRFGNLQTIITHAIVAVITVAIAVPCIYWTINASLEATINNYRASQVVFGQLYREHGKIKTKTNMR